MKDYIPDNERDNYTRLVKGEPISRDDGYFNSRGRFFAFGFDMKGRTYGDRRTSEEFPYYRPGRPEFAWRPIDELTGSSSCASCAFTKHPGQASNYCDYVWIGAESYNRKDATHFCILPTKVLAPKVQPIYINEGSSQREVTIAKDGSLNVGCVKIDKDTVEKIIARRTEVMK